MAKSKAEFNIKNGKLINHTSLFEVEFYEMLPFFEQAYTTYFKYNKFDGTARKRMVSKRKDNVFRTPEDALFFILFYLKTYPLEEVMASMFLMSQPQVNLWKRLLQNILEECLKKMNYLPARDNKKLNKLIEQMNTAAVIIDATERAIQRPIDNDVQEEYYSGKKKMHSVKNTVIRAFESNYILYLGGTFEGKAHDKTILEAEEIHFSKNINGYFDLAYLKLIIKNLKLILPHKKPKGKELTEQQKQENKEMSQIRVGVEHSIGALKRLHILKHKLRVKKKYQYDQLIFLGCGIHNYRVIKRVKSIIN